ncbi:hypothetical protein [Falsiroseomonas sp.]|uniref:hypothetical protein n=1 Tax=Falsiroseomonas sp. TaxID=2870721 RepID=UPI00356482DE
MRGRRLLVVATLSVLLPAACGPRVTPGEASLPEPYAVGLPTGSYAAALATGNDLFDQGVLDPDIRPD